MQFYIFLFIHCSRELPNYCNCQNHIIFFYKWCCYISCFMEQGPNKFFFLIHFWLCWVFVSMRGLSLLAASRGHSSSRCTGLSLSWPLLSRSTGSRRAGSVVVAHRLCCSVACGILPDQGSNPCPLHWQADSQPLRHQGSPLINIFWVNNLFWNFRVFFILQLLNFLHWKLETKLCISFCIIWL